MLNRVLIVITGSSQAIRAADLEDECLVLRFEGLPVLTTAACCLINVPSWGGRWCLERRLQTIPKHAMLLTCFLPRDGLLTLKANVMLSGLYASSDRVPVVPQWKPHV